MAANVKERYDLTLSLSGETLEALKKQAATERLTVEALLTRVFEAVGRKARELHP